MVQLLMASNMQARPYSRSPVSAYQLRDERNNSAGESCVLHTAIHWLHPMLVYLKHCWLLSIIIQLRPFIISLYWKTWSLFYTGYFGSIKHTMAAEKEMPKVKHTRIITVNVKSISIFHQGNQRSWKALGVLSHENHLIGHYIQLQG